MDIINNFERKPLQQLNLNSFETHKEEKKNEQKYLSPFKVSNPKKALSPIDDILDQKKGSARLKNASSCIYFQRHE